MKPLQKQRADDILSAELLKDATHSSADWKSVALLQKSRYE
jgi:hypothetical protein